MALRLPLLLPPPSPSRRSARKKAGSAMSVYVTCIDIHTTSAVSLLVMLLALPWPWSLCRIRCSAGRCSSSRHGSDHASSEGATASSLPLPSSSVSVSSVVAPCSPALPPCPSQGPLPSRCHGRRSPVACQWASLALGYLRLCSCPSGHWQSTERPAPLVFVSPADPCQPPCPSSFCSYPPVSLAVWPSALVVHPPGLCSAILYLPLSAPAPPVVTALAIAAVHISC